MTNRVSGGVSEVLVVEGVESIADFLKASEVPQAGDAVRTAWARIEEWMAKEHVASLDGWCYKTSRLSQDEFNEFGVPGGILEGTIRLADNDHLEHRANLIRSVSFYAFVDLASRQFGRGMDGFMIVTPPAVAVMREALSREYRWV